MAGWIDFSALTGTQAVAIWGAATGTIGTITGVLGLWLRFSHQNRDQARLKCEAVFEFEISNGVPRPKYKIIARSVGRRPVTLDAIEYSYNPPKLKDRLLRRRLWKEGKCRNKDDLGRIKHVSLSEGEKKEFLIEEVRLAHLDKVVKVFIIDQTGRRWPVMWPNSKQLAKQTKHGEIDRIEEDSPNRTCKIVGYILKENFYIFAYWNKDPPKKSTFVSRTFGFDQKRNYTQKMQVIRSDLLPKLMAGEIDEIS